MGERTVAFRGKVYALDEFGFLEVPEAWDEDFADGMARKLGIYGGLTEEHWAFIRYLRRKFLDERTVPLVVHACADNRLRLARLRALFPLGYHRCACKIAGINYAFMADTDIWLTFENKLLVIEEHEATEQGFLKGFDDWNERFAQRVAGEWNLPDGLTDRHWQVIRFLRSYYAQHKALPSIYETCKAADLDLDTFGALFPDGYRRGACRAAGLPFFA